MPETDPIARRIEFVARMEARIGSLAGRNVLDLGCGREALWTRAYVARGARVLALEIDPGRCRDAVTRLREVRPDADAASTGGRVLTVVRGDGERLPFPAASFAFVHCAQVLEHVRSPA